MAKEYNCFGNQSSILKQKSNEIKKKEKEGVKNKERYHAAHKAMHDDRSIRNAHIPQCQDTHSQAIFS